MTTNQDIERVMEEFKSRSEKHYTNGGFLHSCDQCGGNLDFDEVRSHLYFALLEAEERGARKAMEECIRLSDTIEGRTDTTFSEWQGFKSFRNEMRDRLEALTKARSNT